MLLSSAREHENVKRVPSREGQALSALGWVEGRETIPTPALRATPPRRGFSE